MANPGLLILGDSIVKYFHEEASLSNQFNVTIISSPGGKIEDIDNDMLEATEYFNYIVIHFGTRNIPGDSVEVVSKKAESLLKQIRNRNPTCHVYFSGILPRRVNKFKRISAPNRRMIASLNEKSRKVNEKLKLTLKECDGFFFIDGQEKSLRLSGTLLQHKLSKDGVHLTRDGISTLFQVLITEVERLNNKELERTVFFSSEICTKSYPCTASSSSNHQYSKRKFFDLNGGGSKETGKTCSACNRDYASNSAYYAHIRLKRCKPAPKIDPVVTPGEKQCTNSGCNFKCKTLPALLQHLENCDGNDSKLQDTPESITSTNETEKENQTGDASINFIVCPDCSTAYSSGCTYRKHLQRCQNTKIRFTKCLDSNCHIQFRNYSSMCKHLEDHHNLNLGVKNLSFKSLEEFYEWKKSEEINSHTMFVKNRGDIKKFDNVDRDEVDHGNANPGVEDSANQEGDTDEVDPTEVVQNNEEIHDIIQYYVCKFDVRPRSSSIPKTDRKKFQGNTIKNTDCPARMYVNVTSDGVNVRYISCHNHELKYKNVKHYRWHSDVKNFIDLMLEKEVPAQKIKDDLKADSIDTAKTFPEKQFFIKTTEINKMKYEFKMKKRLHKNDAVSVQLLIESLGAEEKDSIFLYKPQGKPVEKGDDSVKCLLTDEDAFVLGIQSERQKIEMIEGCKNILVIDATHSTNVYDFYLVNLIVPDEYGVGYPVAHFITNQVDTPTMIACYTALKLKCPDLKVKSFITDDDPALYNSFSKVFGPEPIHLLCKWHVKRAWNGQSHNKIKNQSLTAEVRKCLHALMEERNVVTFKEMLNNFLSKFKDICPEFCKYFSTYYEKRCKLWAMCYRNFPHAGTDTTVYCESLHNKIKTGYLGRKFNRRVDDLIYTIFKLDKDLHLALLYKRLTEEPPLGKKSPKNSRHMKGMLILDEDVTALTDIEFEVKSQSQTDVTYSVQLVSEKCNSVGCYIECNQAPCGSLCCHMYTCSCEDMNALCKHIHKVHAWNMPQINSNSVSQLSDCDDPSDDPLNLCEPPTRENIQSSDPNFDNLAISCEKQMGELQLLLKNNKTHPLLHHIEKSLKLLVSQCKGLISSNTTFPAPPKMNRNSVAPNQKLIPQERSFYRTTKKKGESKKLYRLLSSNSEFTEVRSSLLNSSSASNFTGSIASLDSVTQLLFTERPYDIKLYHIKSLDHNISRLDDITIKSKVPDFVKGWLYDCVIYSFLVKISSNLPAVKIVDPCVSQIIGTPNRDALKSINIIQFETLYIPCNPTENHWILLIVHPRLRIIEFFDPASDVIAVCYYQFLGHWVKNLSLNSGIRISEWKINVPLHFCQSDNINCGVFVTWYSNQCLKNLSTNESFDVEKYRLHMYETLKANF